MRMNRAGRPAAGMRHFLEIPMRDDCVQVTVNGRPAGVLLWPPYVTEVTGLIRDGGFNNQPAPVKQTYLLQVGTSLAAMDAALRRFLRLLLWGVPAGLLVAILAGRWMATVALDSRYTLYSRWGDWFGATCVVIGKRLES